MSNSQIRKKWFKHVDSLPGLTVDERAVMYVMACHASEDGLIRITEKQVAREMGRWRMRAIAVNARQRQGERNG